MLKNIKTFAAMAFFSIFGLINSASASEIDLNIPSLTDVTYNFNGTIVSGYDLMIYGMWVCGIGIIFGLYEFFKIRRMPAHPDMLRISETIYAPCRTYMHQQGRLLAVLECFIGACIFYYFFYLNGLPLAKVLNILLWSVLGILGSYLVAWF